MAPLALYQVPTRKRKAIDTSAATENHAMLDCPFRRTMKAARSGPSAEPKLPPTWKNDCANPWRPPDAARAIRDDSGWKIDDPNPTSPVATSTILKLAARDRTSIPSSVKPMPVARMYALGCLSV